MNRPITRLYGFVAILFAILIAFTSRWTIFEASSLRDNPLNARMLLDVDRGATVIPTSARCGWAGDVSGWRPGWSRRRPVR